MGTFHVCFVIAPMYINVFFLRIRIEVFPTLTHSWIHSYEFVSTLMLNHFMFCSWHLKVIYEFAAPKTDKYSWVHSIDALIHKHLLGAKRFLYTFLLMVTHSWIHSNKFGSTLMYNELMLSIFCCWYLTVFCESTACNTYEYADKHSWVHSKGIHEYIHSQAFHCRTKRFLCINLLILISLLSTLIKHSWIHSLVLL